MGTLGNRAEIWDYIDLALLHLAKIGRRKLDVGDDPEAFYNEFFNENDVQVMSSGGDLRRRYRSDVLSAAASEHMPSGAKVLDVGCGTGDNLRYLLREEVSYFGIEYAENTARVARRILGERAEIRTGSATSIPFDAQTFDLVLCIEVLEHIPDDEGVCAEIARVLKTEAALILSLPYRHWFPSYVKAMGHFRHYTRSDVEAMLLRHGLTVTRYLPNFPRWSRFANYAYVTCRTYTLLLRLFGIRQSPVKVKLPFMTCSLMEALLSCIDNIRKREERQDYSCLETSTFVLVRKI